MNASIEGYQLGFLLGEGGIGAVFAAFHPKQRRWAAIKVPKTLAPALLYGADVSPELLPRLQRESQTIENEIRILERNSPAVVSLIVAGAIEEVEGEEQTLRFDPPVPFFIQHLAGPSLRYFHQVLKEHRLRLPWEMRYQLALQLIATIQLLHQGGMTSGDISQQNVVFWSPDSEALRVALIDLGLGRAGQTSQSILGGNVEYIPPEWIAYHVVPSRVRDLFASGVLLFEVLAGVPSWKSLISSQVPPHEQAVILQDFGHRVVRPALEQLVTTGEIPEKARQPLETLFLKVFNPSFIREGQVGVKHAGEILEMLKSLDEQPRASSPQTSLPPSAQPNSITLTFRFSLRDVVKGETYETLWLEHLLQEFSPSPLPFGVVIATRTFTIEVQPTPAVGTTPRSLWLVPEFFKPFAETLGEDTEISLEIPVKLHRDHTEKGAMA